ncbi:MAG: hypothetical protein KDD82_11855 [Planctomycetes bacterium]|nr:hypothetical protein [Planctomycetota bacterium]
MKPPQGSDGLRRLAEQSRTLLGELDHARPELLSIAELNRTLRQVLLNQAALLEALAEAPRPQIKVLRAKPAELSPLELSDLEVDADELAASKNGLSKQAPEAADPERVAPKHTDPNTYTDPKPEPRASSEAPAERGDEATSGDGAAAEGNSATALLAETETIPKHLCRGFVCDFDNRDRDYDKGLEKLNRWISAGSSGTPFQWRGDHAYLNLKGAGANSARTYEEQIMARMGFSRRLGRLAVPGLEGDVVVYERPS